MTKDEALTMALEALEYHTAQTRPIIETMATINVIKEALAQPNAEYERGFVDGMQKQMQSSVDKAVNMMAQPEQEPVAWAYVNSDDECEQIEYCTESPMPEFVPLYTSPPKRQPLTDEQLDALAIDDDGLPNSHFEFARAIEKAHGIGDKT
jgi:hypothetical protein